MTKINQYMFLLNLSVKYIKAALDDYNQRDDQNVDKSYYEKLYSIDYHMFTFTQLIYTLKNKLIVEYPEDEQDIEDFFDSGNNVSISRKIANRLKHSNVNLIETFHIRITQHLDESTSSVITVDRKASPDVAGVPDKKLSEVFDKAYQELTVFLNGKGYKY